MSKVDCQPYEPAPPVIVDNRGMQYFSRDYLTELSQSYQPSLKPVAKSVTRQDASFQTAPEPRPRKRTVKL